MAAILLGWRELAPEVREFEFAVEGVEQFAFVPGQWVSLVAVVHGREITRAYSIASTPEDNRFRICLNRVEGGVFSPHLFALERGASVGMKGPYGTFLLRDAARDAIFVATGTGIVPFRSMLADVMARGMGAGRITLIFGVRHESSLYYRDEFERWAGQNARFRFKPVLSRGGEDWLGARGHVQEHVMAELGDRRDVDVYICGLKAMVDDLRRQLKAAGVDRSRIVFEKYD
jgi:CDP-4-dehydro-6-deoxyglucose reductase